MWISLAVALFQGLLKALGIYSVAQERNAGADASQNEANNAEIDRVNRAADAGTGVRPDPTDTNDRDRP